MSRMKEFLRGLLLERRNGQEAPEADGEPMCREKPLLQEGKPEDVAIAECEEVEQTASNAEDAQNLLEKANPALLAQVQVVLGTAMELAREPGSEAIGKRLADGVGEFSWILKEEGLEVDSDDPVARLDAYTVVVGEDEKAEARVLRPAIFRNGAVILKGIRLVPPGGDPLRHQDNGDKE